MVSKMLRWKAYENMFVSSMRSFMVIAVPIRPRVRLKARNFNENKEKKR